MTSSSSTSRPTLEEERRRELVLRCLKDCNVEQYEADVVDTLTRWIAQESKLSNSDMRSDLASSGVSADLIPQLIVKSLSLPGELV